MLPAHSDAVVIGGGAMGVAALHYLVELGCSSPVLLERETLGCGSTGHCAGGVRTLFSDELNVRVCQESIERLRGWGDELDLRLWGYLFLLDDPADVESFEAALELQQRCGIAARWTDPLDHVPQLDVDGVLAAAFCPEAGYVTPDLVVQGYARRAAAAGARIVQSCPATRIVVRDGRVAAVETQRGTIETERVICAAGVWSRELAATAGVDLPVSPERRYMWFTEDAPGFPHELPLTIDFSTGFYFHRESGGLAFGGREQSLEDVAPHAAARLPALGELGVRSSWWGYYEMSPDHNALIGATAEPAGLVYGTGFSGHGFQQAPVVGEHLAQLALGLEPTFDLSAFGIERFAAGAARVEHNIV